jgi:nitrite reductase (NO-forming)
VGDTVRITLINSDPIPHDLKIDAFNIASEELLETDQSTVVEFIADKSGIFEYYCSIEGHLEAGMKGTLLVGGVVEVGNREELADSLGSGNLAPSDVTFVSAADPNAISIVRNPFDVAPSFGFRAPATVRVDLETLEVVGVLADGTTFNYFTFNGQVPGPFIRVKQGDTVELYLKNDPTSLFVHSVAISAITGPGAGSIYNQTAPGGESKVVFKALTAGLYVYYCATPSIPHHISSGMYGLIYVEPPSGSMMMGREFYIMQGEIYTDQPAGTHGHVNYDFNAAASERPTYYVFNGAVGGLTTEENALYARVGETIRIYFGVGGPNYGSSFHIVGESFDNVTVGSGGNMTMGSSQPAGISTVYVPVGGAAIVEFTVEVPGRYQIIDHSYSRVENGLLAYLYVEGEEQPDIYRSEELAESAGH